MRIWILGSLSGLLLLFTALPLSRRCDWWIRGLDFPRSQFAVSGLCLLIVGGWLLDHSQPVAWIVLGVLAVCTAYQTWWIFPYTPLHRKEVPSASRDTPAPRLRIMSANVMMSNRRAADLIAIVRAEQPDVLVTLESDRWWEQQLAALEPEYPHAIKCPLSNRYGMHLYSRLPLEDSRVQHLIERDVPSFHLLVVLPSQDRVQLHCLHPAPPSPTENETSSERDAELVMVGKSVIGTKYPVIVTGDLNDVAWSATTRLFRKVSGLLDPRIGRGRYNSFHTQHWLLRWPLDHFFHSGHFDCVELKRLPAFGSDHFPMLLELALGPRDESSDLSTDRDDHEQAEEKMDVEGADESQVHRPGETRPASRAAPPQP